MSPYPLLASAVFVEANAANFSHTERRFKDINYIVMHYTGNINDTARNNAYYFKENAVQSSAHFFVSDDSIYQCVDIQYPAYAVGLGSRTKPYTPNPLMYRTITNTNSVSIEMCGSKTSREATENTKDTAARLCVELLEKLDLTPSCVYRHYDVTGKLCPAWAVEDELKWLDMLLKITNYYYGKERDDLTDTPENYEVFKTFMDRYFKEQAVQPADYEQEAMEYCRARGLINGGMPKSFVERGQLATVLQRMNA